MKRTILLSLIILALACSLFDSGEDGTLSISATDSAILKAGQNIKLTAGAKEASLGYMDGTDTVWIPLLEKTDTFTIALKMSDRCYIGDDTIKVSDYSHPFDFFKLIVLPPTITMDDTLILPVQMAADTLVLFMAFTEQLKLDNGYVNLVIDFHSDKWLDLANPFNSIDAESIVNSVTVDIE